MAIEDQDIGLMKHHIVEYISNSFSKVTPLFLIKEISSLFNCERSKVKSAIQSLVFENEIEYNYSFGNSFLDVSFNRTVQVSKHVKLLPHNFTISDQHENVSVRLYNGISFGSGQHPTTRLSIQAIDFLIRDVSCFTTFKETSVLDIGTGNGILAIASVQLGIQRALAIDIEEFALKEATDNVKLNGLDDRVEVSNIPLHLIQDKFSLIIANLRLPTLAQIFPHVRSLLREDGSAVISGLKDSEVGQIIDLYSKDSFTLTWSGSEKGWSCIILAKNL